MLGADLAVECAGHLARRRLECRDGDIDDLEAEAEGVDAGLDPLLEFGPPFRAALREQPVERFAGKVVARFLLCYQFNRLPGRG